MNKPPYEPDETPTWQWLLLPLLCWETYAVLAALTALIYAL